MVRGCFTEGVFMPLSFFLWLVNIGSFTLFFNNLYQN
jgi:hypothetical protein